MNLCCIKKHRVCLRSWIGFGVDRHRMNGLPRMHEAQRFDRSTKQRKLNKFFRYLCIFINILQLQNSIYDTMCNFYFDY